MMGNPRVVINALDGIDSALERYGHYFKQSTASADSFATGAEHALENCRRVLEYELDIIRRDLDNALRELQNCQRQNCLEEERAVQALRDRMDEVQQKLYQLRRLADILEAARRDYYAELQQMHSVVERTIPQAREFIRERREALEDFERGGSSGIFPSFL